MVNVFSIVVGMSITSSLAITVILMLRLFMRRMPKIFSYLLWIIVWIRLVCPVLPGADFGIVPGLEMLVPQIFSHTESLAEDNVPAQTGSESEPEKGIGSETGATDSEMSKDADSKVSKGADFEAEKRAGEKTAQQATLPLLLNSRYMLEDASHNPFEGFISALEADFAGGLRKILESNKEMMITMSYLWAIVWMLLLLYEAAGCFFFMRKLGRAESDIAKPGRNETGAENQKKIKSGTAKLRKTESRTAKLRKIKSGIAEKSAARSRFEVKVIETLDTPFTAGLLKPVVYLPKGLTQGERELVLAHEKVHIWRKDYLVKPLLFLITCFHWFNPFVWAAFYLTEKDMELSCDEAVLRKVGYGRKKEYAGTLLKLAESGMWKPGYPIAFGENSVKSRIKNTVKVKKAALWKIIIGAVIVAAAAIVLLVNVSKQRMNNMFAAADAQGGKTILLVNPGDNAEQETSDINNGSDEESLSNGGSASNENNLSGEDNASDKEGISGKKNSSGEGSISGESNLNHSAGESSLDNPDNPGNPDAAAPPFLPAEKAQNPMSAMEGENSAPKNMPDAGAFPSNDVSGAGDANESNAEFVYSGGGGGQNTNYVPSRDAFEVILLESSGTHEDLEILYAYPVEYSRISDTFGERVHPITGQKRIHSGIDFAADKGTPVWASADGTVIKTGYDADCGNYVILLHSNGDMTYYACCDEILAAEGKQVERGEQIATVGSTGRSTGAHLHFALSRGGSYIEPKFQNAEN